MKANKRDIQFHIVLTPPDITVDIGKYRIDLVKKLTIDFLPYAGMYFRFTPKLPKKRVTHWSPLIKASHGPDGDRGLGLNTDFWMVDKVFYYVEPKKFEVFCYFDPTTAGQFAALRELMITYYGFQLDSH